MATLFEEIKIESVNLDSFCIVQQHYWRQYTKQISQLPCKKCGDKTLTMISKWKCICSKCKTKHTIRKPKKFPKNTNNKKNWKATCCECGGIMDFYETKSSMAYICRKCSNCLEV